MIGWDALEVPLGAFVPEKSAEIFGKVGVNSVGDLLRWLPRRYVDHGSNANIDELEVGSKVTFVGTVTWTRQMTSRGGKRLFMIGITDGENDLSATFFGAYAPARDLTDGVRAFFVGTLDRYQGKWQLKHPDYKVIECPGHLFTQDEGQVDEGEQSTFVELVQTLPLLPIYPTRSVAVGRKTVRIDSWTVLEAVMTVLRKLPEIPDPLPRTPQGFYTFDQSVRAIHLPKTLAVAQRARKRLAFNEALGVQLIVTLRKVDTASRPAPACSRQELIHTYRDQLLENLPFELTEGQQQVIEEISGDLEKTTPMTRLLQGDVGSGKTMVALVSMLQAVDAGRQAALLAPTEVLAQQHARSLTMMLADAGLPTTLTVLTGSMTPKEKQQALLNIMTGQTDLVVGTHALLGEHVEFFDLGFVVIDEQHRFGVEQRSRLRTAGKEVSGVHLTPHQLVMTATPIPRTVALTAFGDLDVSTIKELPGGRKPIQSAVVPEWKSGWVDRAYQRIREEVAKGHQAYVVCPRIDGEGGVVEVAEQLADGELSGLRLGVLHGRLAGSAKDEVMRAFSLGKVDVLISTTVIEVGVDVPNATLMMIRESERFGVSQLHQLRGRVGRGSASSLCLFHTTQEQGSDSFRRIQEVAQTSDGFKLAELDLLWRSEGDLLGEEQHGRSSHLQLLDVVKHADILSEVTDEAWWIVSHERTLAEKLVSQFTEDERDKLDQG